MRGRTSSRGRHLAVAFMLACALSPAAIAAASAGEYNREYEQALSVGL
jgi:hypothetical protein